MKDDYGSKKLVVFDLDGTLAPSKSRIESDMADLVVRLLAEKKMAVISGGGFPQFETQFLSALPHESRKFSNLYLMPTSGTRLYVWRGNWKLEYAEDFTTNEKKKIMSAFDRALKEYGWHMPEKVYGDLIEDRDSQITFSALGQKAPLQEKGSWDPDHSKREKIASILRGFLPEFDVRIGGMTSIDVTRRGVNKAYGMRKLENHLKLKAEEIVFVGDALYFGGNDYPVIATGIDCVPVSGPEETKGFIEGLVDMTQ